MSISRSDGLEGIRTQMRTAYLGEETRCVESLLSSLHMSPQEGEQISSQAMALVSQVRDSSSPTMMEKFLGEYGLSSKEGVALMCMAEALLRVPDKATIDALIEDKLQAGDWSSHLGHSDSSLINSSTWALLVTGKLLAPVDSVHVGATLRGMVKRLGEPVVRAAVAQAMKELGSQFVLGRNMAEATRRGRKMEKKGYTYSFDMLGEAARTASDAQRYRQAYSQAITDLAGHCSHQDIRDNPGISVKLSALHPRYEWGQRERVMEQLVPSVLALAEQAKEANMGFNIDAEEADRLELSLDVIAAVLASPSLADWHGFGVVVQAFSKRAPMVLDWLYAVAKSLDRKLMVRLVKGAYWDAEIKRAQVLGLAGFPVFTRKANTDLSYLACAKQLLAMDDRLYGQFATHNAHSVAAVIHMAGNKAFEFQRLHGMGESLHASVMSEGSVRCRIYAPVGAHEDLLAYLVRRLLENGANSSFVQQLVNPEISPAMIAQNPVASIQQRLLDKLSIPSQVVAQPQSIFGAERCNAKGWDITDVATLRNLYAARAQWHNYQWQGQALVVGNEHPEATIEVRNPADESDIVGLVQEASGLQVATAIGSAQYGQQAWQDRPVIERAACFERVAQLYEKHAAELFVLLAREAGKNWLDAVGEVREAVDFARFYAQQMLTAKHCQGRGVIACISPWNFPLAIFSGQVLASLAAGNAVLAKPASQTQLIAFRAVQLMHEAGIPLAALQYLPGGGTQVGGPITSNPAVHGVCFTGSTATAQHINQIMAQNLAPSAPIIAETGGLNAMVVDSTALAEQVVRDVLASAFQSAGQRCSALRMLYLQEDVADKIMTMLFGAMDELQIGNPQLLSTDVGPVIDQAAKRGIEAHIQAHRAQGKILKQLSVPNKGLFVAPTVIKLVGIEELEQEIFGPVLHVATFAAQDLDKVVDTINAQGYGLTFGVHTRVDARVEQMVSRIQAGNTYVNRNQIGAVVGSQPFGGEGLSGTGPKAGGPQYVQRLRQPKSVNSALPSGPIVSVNTVQAAMANINADIAGAWRESSDRLLQLAQVFGPDTRAIADLCRDKLLLPGPTGELNQLSTLARGVVLCLGPAREQALWQTRIALAQGNTVILVANDINLPEHNLPLVVLPGQLPVNALATLTGMHAVACNAEPTYQQALRQALAEAEGELIPLITETLDEQRYTVERHLCIDTTAAGGNASLIAAGE
ncbi:MAG: bifunctional proline dehydrogenase/L-glutamate gamma-semialdehyde dehydrogenase PutA [Gammaproteobacteria bacterium]|nr:bifunctional proline dehydrogenase/L-glutamate gamma-semialdehyde dehydrogenase PutA [Gammaproteobacteria bacterium]